MDERDQSVTHAPTKQLQAQVPVITDHFRKWFASPTLQQRQHESFGSTACEEGRPAVHPCLLGATSQDWTLTSCLGFGQVPDKSGGFVRPPAAHFGAQDNQSGAAVPTVELRVSGLLAPPSRGEGCAADVGATGVGSPIPTKWRHQGGVHGKLGAMEQGQPVTTTSILRLSNRSGAARSMSWNLTLEDTRPPASRQTLAAADSRANPLRINTPAMAHAARWWPLESSGRPHRQERLEGGRGSQRRRRSSTRKREESSWTNGGRDAPWLHELPEMEAWMVGPRHSRWLSQRLGAWPSPSPNSPPNWPNVPRPLSEKRCGDRALRG